MNKFTKAIALIISLSLVLVSFASCGLIEDTEVVEKVQNLKKTVLVIDGDIEVTGAEFGWYWSNAYNTAYSEAQAKAEEDAAADSAAASDASSSGEGAEAPEVEVDAKAVKKETIEQITATKMACVKAKEAGIKLSGADYTNIDSQIEQYRSSMLSNFTEQGFNISYNDYLAAMNTDADAVAKIFEEEYLASLYYASFSGEGYVTAKHILVQYDNEVHTRDEALKIANEIKAELDGGADFDKLMKEKSEDVDQSGKVNSPEGYTFKQDGSMVPEFEKAAFELEENAVSGLVEVKSQGYSGFHILKRIPTSLSGIAMNLSADTIKAEGKKLIKDVDVKEKKLIEYFTKEN